MTIEEKLELFGMLVTICGILAIFFLLLTVFLFWQLHIKEAFLERTGIAKRKSINEMQELNALSGRMTKSSAAKVAEQEFTGNLTGERKRGRKNKTGEIHQTQQPPAAQQAPGTSVLTQEADATSVLAPASPGTTVLSSELTGGTAQASAPAPVGGKFVVIIHQQFIHTDECI